MRERWAALLVPQQGNQSQIAAFTVFELNLGLLYVGKFVSLLCVRRGSLCGALCMLPVPGQLQLFAFGILNFLCSQRHRVSPRFAAPDSCGEIPAVMRSAFLCFHAGPQWHFRGAPSATSHFKSTGVKHQTL